MNYKVLLTTSGIGSRLGELTDYTNKCLVRIGNKPAISLIIEKYPQETEFVVTLGHYGKYVKEYVKLAHPKTNFTFVEVDNYKGPGSSLGYSILQAKDLLQCPFIFNACDTLFSNSKIIEKCINSKENFCVGSERQDSSQYATLLTNGDNLIQIKKKGELKYDFAYVGLCGIRDYKLFWKLLKETYDRDPLCHSLHEGRIINQMISDVKFKCYETSSWLDIGNVGELEKTRKHFGSFAEVLEKKQESIYFFDDFVVKFFSNSKINDNRVKRAKLLSDIVPNVIEYGNNFYKYNLVDGDLMASDVNINNFKQLLLWSKEKLWFKKNVDNFKDICYNFYITKTSKRIDMFLEGSEDKEVEINGTMIPPIQELLEKIDTNWLCNGTPVQFHGDFILDNILKTKDGFCLLDWRQDFGGKLDVGDIYYDLSKLNHNLIVNHETVNKGLYNHVNNNCHIMCNSRLIECREILKKFIINEGYDYKKVQVLTSLIWLNMAPLHEYPFNKFLFNFGKLNLYGALIDD